MITKSKRLNYYYVSDGEVTYCCQSEKLANYVYDNFEYFKYRP